MLAAVLMATAACGAYQFPGAPSSPSPSPSPVAGTVSGRVLAVPCAPIQPASGGIACAGRPVPNLELDYFGGGGVVRKAFTDAGGSYSVELPAGSYVVKLRTNLRVLSGPLNLTVAEGSSTVANYLLDSGIRVPVPQQ